MENLFTLGNLVDLVMLVMLQAVLGFDNLLYISLESRRAPADKQSYVRKMGIALAVIFRIVLCKGNMKEHIRNIAKYKERHLDKLGSRQALSHLPLPEKRIVTRMISVHIKGT